MKKNHIFIATVIIEHKALWFVIVAIIIGSSLAYIYFSQDRVPIDLSAQKILELCGGDVQCTSEHLQSLAEKEEPSIVLLTFEDLLSTYSESNNFCHTYAHHLGKFLYSYVGNVTEALSYTNPLLCGGAAYHGIVQTYMISQLSGNKNPTNIDITTICPKNSDNPHPIERWECLHGVGHGLTSINNYDVFAAVKRCDEFEHGWERVSCAKGLFMENVFNYAKTGVGAIKEDDLLFPCNAVEDRFASPCYHYQATHIFNQHINIDDAMDECDKVVEQYIKNCYRGMGRKLAPNIFDNNKLSVLCQMVHKEYQTDCYKGVAMVFADNRSTGEALEFCKTIPEEFKSDCYGEIGKWIQLVYSTNEKRAQECSKSENSDYFDICMNATLEGILIL